MRKVLGNHLRVSGCHNPLYIGICTLFKGCQGCHKGVISAEFSRELKQKAVLLHRQEPLNDQILERIHLQEYVAPL